MAEQVNVQMYTTKAPGIYVEEAVGIRPIQAAETSIPAFIGFTAQAAKTIKDKSGTDIVKPWVKKPQVIANWTEYTKIYGFFAKGLYLPEAIYNHFNCGGGACYVYSLGAQASTGVPTVNVLNDAGAPVFTVTAKDANDPAKKVTITKVTGTDFKIDVDGDTQDASMVDGPKFIGDLAFAKAKISSVDKTLVPKQGTYNLTVPAAPAAGLQIVKKDLEAALLELEGFDNIRLIVCPDAVTDANIANVKENYDAILTHCRKEKLYRFAILDTPAGKAYDEIITWFDALNIPKEQAIHGAIYYPWVESANMIDEPGGDKTRMVPPSGYISGLYGQTDQTRGVHKAPANEALMGAVGLQYRISSEQQAMLNVKGINCIREFQGQGIRVWGARTLASVSDTPWRYVNVRRLFDWVEASLETGLQWVVFEPNNPDLWARVTRDINAFLKLVWRSGALFGTTPEQAFYVKCDEELNPFEVRDQGVLVIQIGMAPVKPAEFVVLQFRQWAGPNAEAS